MIFFLCYLIIGAFAGTIAGLLGLGGGIIIIPCLLLILPKAGIPNDVLMPVAIATSLGSVIITTCTASWIQFKKNNIDLSLLKKTAPLIVLAAILGPLLAHHLQTGFLKLAFTILLFFVAFKMFHGANLKDTPRPMPSRWQVLPVVFILGALSALLGLGGGVLLMPYLNRCGLSLRLSIGTASAAAMIVAITATASYLVLGQHLATPIPHSMGYLYLPAFLGLIATSMLFAKWGVELSHRLPISKLKKGFAVLLFLVACHMLASLC